MKSVVVEIKNGFAAVLSDDGSIVKIKNENYVIGQVIEMKIKKIHFSKKWALGIASAAVLLLSTSIGAWAYTTPYSYVSLDVNPSIEYTLNRFDRVIDVKAVNDDGQVILDQINIDGLTNQSIEDAIMSTVDQISQDGYFSGSTTAATGSAIVVGDGSTTTPTDSTTTAVSGSAITIDGGIMITVASGSDGISEQLANELRTAVEAFVSDNVEVEVESIGLERVQEARELGVTPGKLNLVQKLQASSDNPDSIVLEDWLNKPVKDIMKAIKQNRKGNPDAEDDKETTLTTTETTAATTATVAETEATEAETAETEKAQVKETQKVEKANAKAESKATKANVKVESKAQSKQEKATEAQVKATEKAKSQQDKVQQKETEAQQKAETAAQKNSDKSTQDKGTNNGASANSNASKSESKSNNGKGNK